MKKNSVYKNIVSATPAINAEYLTSILNLKNYETINQTEISKDFDSNTASIIRACIHIKSENNQTIKKLFIKAAKPDSKNNAYHDKSMREVSFYGFLLSHHDIEVPVPKCYDAYSSEEDGEFFIILEDLSDNYRTVSDSDLLDERIWFSCAESLAKFHAAFWNDPQLIDERTVMNEQEAESDIRRNREYLDSFLTEFQYMFDEKTIRIFKHAFEINSQLIRESSQESSKKNPITVYNGDSIFIIFWLRMTTHTSL
ncbi:MAG: protein kinase family protein [Eubacteriales bacterium]